MKIFLSTEPLNDSLYVANNLISFITERGHLILNIRYLKNGENQKASVVFEDSLSLLKKSDFVILLHNIYSFNSGFVCSHSTLNLNKKTLLLYNQKDESSLPLLAKGCTLNNFYLKAYKNIDDIKTILTLFNL
jgi:hypothetical protein